MRPSREGRPLNPSPPGRGGFVAPREAGGDKPGEGARRLVLRRAIFQDASSPPASCRLRSRFVLGVRDGHLLRSEEWRFGRILRLRPSLTRRVRETHRNRESASSSRCVARTLHVICGPAGLWCFDGGVLPPHIASKTPTLRRRPCRLRSERYDEWPVARPRVRRSLIVRRAGLEVSWSRARSISRWMCSRCRLRRKLEIIGDRAE